MRRTTRAPVAAALGIPIVTLLVGCSTVVSMEPAEFADDPACAGVIVNLPERLAGLDPRETDAQGTKAWGDPTSVRLRCGVPPPPPTAEFPCFTIDGIDWLRDAQDEPITVFTTYGRDPAVQVIIDGAAVSGEPVLSGLAGAVAGIPPERACVAVTDVR